LFDEWPHLSNATKQRVGEFVNKRGSVGAVELGRVIRALDTTAPVADRRRLHAIECRIGCHAVGAPFSRGMLRVWLERRGITGTSSTMLTTLVRWAGAGTFS
jgi:hypothetical protein